MLVEKMERKINRIKLFINNDDRSKEVGERLKKELLNSNFLIVNDKCDLAISVGGDGSFLRMIKENDFNSAIYYIGVNSGTLGFLQEIDINKTKDFIERLNKNDYKIEELGILESNIYTKNNVYQYNSLNEVVIRKADFSILKTDVYRDNELLENFTGDGLLISTSTGSTAYNMSFKGSIVYNTINTLQITPIAPINNKAYNTLTNSLVIPHDKIVTLDIEDKDNLFLMVDGKNYFLDNVYKVENKISKEGIKCLRMNEFHFIKIVNQKIIEKA